jgi:uncharacterized membrane protein YdjX (TVP38/TMEM64 family)
VRFVVLVVLLGGLAASALVVGPPDPAAVSGAVRSAGIAGPVLAISVAAVLSAAMVPRNALAVAGGLVFGPVAGAVYVLVGSAVGAVLAFALGRWLGRDVISGWRRAAHADRWLAARGTLAVLTVRLLPVAPFGLASYVFGTTGVTTRAYILGTVLGVVPSTVVYANLGAHATEPGTAAFGWSLALTVVLAAAGAGTAAVLARARGARRNTNS